MKHKIRINGEIQELECQFGSGVVDKNGREIFEGDRVRAIYTDAGIDVTGEIVFRDGDFFIASQPIYQYMSNFTSNELEIVDD